MTSLALYNLKGGVGKTAATVNLAYLAAADGLKTLVWDLDPQGSSSFLTDVLGVSLYVSTAVFGVLLGLIFEIWYRNEKTLSIHTIVTRKRELFYWAAILVTFALGTAAGDLATEAIGLGFSLGVLVFGFLLVMMGMAAYLGANRVLTFWFAYILTRPFGASLGDLLSQSREYGGMGMGTIVTSVVFLSVIVLLVILHTATRTRHSKASAT